VELYGQVLLMTADAAFISEKGELLGHSFSESPSQGIPQEGHIALGAGRLDGDAGGVRVRYTDVAGEISQAVHSGDREFNAEGDHAVARQEEADRQEGDGDGCQDLHKYTTSGGLYT
jgi:hypothetical protein